MRYIEPIRATSRSTGRTALELAILGLLLGSDLHGYELRKRLSTTLGPVGRLSFGTLYPALNRLEKADAVEVTKVSESRTGLTTARGRKVYRITEPGRRMFEELLETPTPSDDDKSFALRLAFARHLTGEARIRLMSRRREQLAKRLSESRAAFDVQTPGDEYTRMLMEHSNDMTARDIAWLDQMISNERRQVAGPPEKTAHRKETTP